MPNPLRTFFDHSRHKLRVRSVDALFDVLAFQGEEHLSQPFNYWAAVQGLVFREVQA
jgi:type VI secretion system secreted protein VgrG